MFRRALIVVAPHGAGESNMIFSQPGTLLIEGRCYDSDKKTNLCYRNMAQALGLRYYGLIYKHKYMNIRLTDIDDGVFSTKWLLQRHSYVAENHWVTKVHPIGLGWEHSERHYFPRIPRA